MTQVSAPNPASASGTTLLERNLAALGVFSGPTASLVGSAAPSSDVEFFDGPDGLIAARQGGRLLCSRHRPREEGEAFARSIPLEAAGGIVVLGFGAGHHVTALAERVRRAGLIIVFEPDVSLLRAVLERVDHTRTFLGSRVVVLTDERDAAGITRAVSGSEGLLAMGVRVAPHPASRARLGSSSDEFTRQVAKVVAAVRTTVVTTLAHAELTLRNQLQNIDRYVTSAGIADLKDAAAGFPAVVVSAGPSLEKNIRALATRGVRDRVVIIAAQTVLKTLLRHGIRPHFVTALDHHEISRRFYEGLTPRAVDGITLVAEAKANPAILEAFPGLLRTPADPVLDRLLEGTAEVEKGALRAGATVAHMGYYLARHLGCDPVALVGQDLGFSDGCYYAPGAAIHEVWSSELNAFNSLEAMEWQRIVRARHLLHRATDVHGRAIYTDEQMATYLVQFEKDFAADAVAGLTTIDATEGGVSKRHTRVATLAAVLESATSRLPDLPTPRTSGGEVLPRVRERLTRTRDDAVRIARAGREAESILSRMIEIQRDQSQIGRLIDRVYALRDEVESLQPAFALVDQINQTGTLNRARADRLIEIDEALTPLQRQRREIERDIVNVRWTADAADSLATLLDGAIATLEGAPRITREATPAQVRPGSPRTRAAAIIALTGEPRTFRGRPAIEHVVERLARCASLDAVLVAAGPDARIPELPGVGVVRTAELARDRARLEAIRAARLWSGWCWRGGIAGLTTYDEVFAPRTMAAAMRESGAEAGVIIGADWALVDPGLVDQAVARFAERPRFAFVQAPPGLGTCVVSRDLGEELANEASGWAGTIGALLGYVPIAPRSDPIAKPECVQTEPGVRDLLARCIPDSDPLRRRLERLGEEDARDASSLARALAPSLDEAADRVPQHVTIELCTGRRTGGLRARWLRGGGELAERPVLEPSVARRVFRELARERSDACVTLGGAGDPLLHPDWRGIIAAAVEEGIASVHLRTDLLVRPDEVEALAGSGVSVVSVDLMADDAATYREIMGVDRHHDARSNLERLLSLRRGFLPWIVPRMTKCEAALGTMERFYDRWLLACGACAIDPHPWNDPSSFPGEERIRAIPRPRPTAWREAARHMTIWSDASVTPARSDRRIGHADREGVAEIWARLWKTRRESIARERNG